jgi:hypothetical protein
MNEAGDERYGRYRTAYLAMAKQARYRPAAPSDGMGHILLSKEEMLDPARLTREAHKYALKFLAADDAMEYEIGCPDFRFNRAFCYAIEAATALCSPNSDLATDLLRMAIEEIASEARIDHGRG